MDEGSPHFLDTFRSTLVQSIDSVAATLDVLLANQALSPEQYARIRAAPTPQDRMRTLLDCVRGWDRCTKDDLCRCLRAENKKVPILERWKPTSGTTNPQHSVYKYGDVLDVECSGASKETAKRNGLQEIGVAASHAMAKRDAGAIRVLKDKIGRVGERRGLDPSLIAALISRSSHAGALLTDGWGQSKCFGLMQISDKFYTLRGEYDSEEHIDQGAEILIEKINFMKRKFPDWSPAWQLKGGTAAYMCGQSRVLGYSNVDENTDNKDFSNDVMARAQWYKREVFS